MAYVAREGGKIVGYSRHANDETPEQVADDDPELIAFLEPGVTAADVEAERERRLAAGFDYDFEDVRGVHRIGTTRDDLVGWDEVDKFAASLRAAGAGDVEVHILTDTGPVTVSADEWAQIMIAAGAFRQPIWAASFLIVAMDPIPENFADNSYWPEV